MIYYIYLGLSHFVLVDRSLRLRIFIVAIGQYAPTCNIISWTSFKG
jgi:hypothetical protein